MKEDTLAAIRRWTFDAALPFWLERGLDREHGGYVEMFDAQGMASAPYKRTRVTGRQIYVFSHAALLGVDGAADAALHGYRFLRDRAWLDDGRWARRMDRSGGLLDATPDLYDTAFVLFALGWYARLSNDPEPVDLALATLDRLDREFRHPAGGFAHELPMTGWRLQNPHMHLLEAALSLMEARPGEPRFAELAAELVELFRTRFFDGATLAEHFDDAWARAPGAAGRVIEPGHQFEWAWILGWRSRLTGVDTTDLSVALHAFAERFGVDPASSLTFNSVDDRGGSLDRRSRTWPNTERIKGALALYELIERDPWADVASSTGVLLTKFLRPQGDWSDEVDGGGEPMVSTVPTSTLYHVFLAFTEALRVGEERTRAP